MKPDVTWSQIAYSVNWFAAAVSDPYPHEASGHSLGEEGHVTPALQLVSWQANPVELIRQRNGLRLWRRFFFPVSRRHSTCHFNIKASGFWPVTRSCTGENLLIVIIGWGARTSVTLDWGLVVVFLLFLFVVGVHLAGFQRLSFGQKFRCKTRMETIKYKYKHQCTWVIYIYIDILKLTRFIFLLFTLGFELLHGLWLFVKFLITLWSAFFIVRHDLRGVVQRTVTHSSTWSPQTIYHFNLKLSLNSPLACLEPEIVSSSPAPPPASFSSPLSPSSSPSSASS